MVFVNLIVVPALCYLLTQFIFSFQGRTRTMLAYGFLALTVVGFLAMYLHKDLLSWAAVGLLGLVGTLVTLGLVGGRTLMKMRQR